MSKILQATSRGQVTLPKSWRDKFKTTYFTVVIKDEELVIKPLHQGKTFKDAVEDSWNQYKKGNFVDQSELMKKYGI